jgi:hypothetical protein
MNEGACSLCGRGERFYETGSGRLICGLCLFDILRSRALFLEQLKIYWRERRRPSQREGSEDSEIKIPDVYLTLFEKETD